MSAQPRQSVSAAIAAVPFRHYFITLLAVLLPIIIISTVRFLPSSPLNLPRFTTDHHRNLDSGINSSELIDLAEFDPEYASLVNDINLLIQGNFGKLSRNTDFLIWRGNLTSDSFRRLHRLSYNVIRSWSFRRLAPDPRSPEKILSDTLGLAFIHRRKKYSSCAVVGNSGVLLSADHGAEIDSHTAVIRLNNAVSGGNFSRHVGTKTTISFINSNVLHRCALRRPYCRCHPYTTSVPVVFYICQPFHILDFISCFVDAEATDHAPFVISDPGFDRFVAKIGRYYSVRRWFARAWGGATVEEWSAAHQGSYFHYSTGMQAVVMAVGVCERVSLFGFGKAANSKHDHYYTGQEEEELKLRDYKAEYEFYRDLMESPERIPFMSSASPSGVKFKFPPVVIHR